MGNNGDGHISAYSPTSGAFLGQLADNTGTPITIPNLWALTFGNGSEGGDAHTLFFAAGYDGDQHGLFGAIQPPQLRGMDTGGSGVFDPDAPGEPEDYPLPPVAGPALQNQNTPAQPVAVLLPMTDLSLALRATLSTISQPGTPAPAVGNPRAVAALNTLGAAAVHFVSYDSSSVSGSADNSVAPEQSSRRECRLECGHPLG